MTEYTEHQFPKELMFGKRDTVHGIDLTTNGSTRSFELIRVWKSEGGEVRIGRQCGRGRWEE